MWVYCFVRVGALALSSMCHEDAHDIGYVLGMVELLSPNQTVLLSASHTPFAEIIDRVVISLSKIYARLVHLLREFQY